MDNRKLNTSEVLNMGILDLPAPESECPKDAILAYVDEYNFNIDSLRNGLESGGLDAPMYYGCWSIWKTESGFSGELAQYRSITDSFSNRTIEEALEKANEWACGCIENP